MRKNYLFGTSLPLRSLLIISFLLTTAACGACKDKKNEKTPLKFTLTAPAVKDKTGMENSKNKNLIVGGLIVKVTEGKDNAANYKLNCDSWQTFTDANYTTADATADSRALFIYAPMNLKELLGEDVLEKGNAKLLPVIFNSQPKKCTSKSGSAKFSIVDKDGKVVGSPVEVKWTDA